MYVPTDSLSTGVGLSPPTKKVSSNIYTPERQRILIITSSKEARHSARSRAVCELMVGTIKFAAPGDGLMGHRFDVILDASDNYHLSEQERSRNYEWLQRIKCRLAPGGIWMDI